MNKDQLGNDIWRACDIMRRDDGTTGIMEYMEQLSWLLFLKVFEAIEDRYETEADLKGIQYTPIIDKEFRWSFWTRKDWAGQEIVEFVNTKLFPYLRTLSGSPEKEIIAALFLEIPGNRMKSPYNLRDVVAIVDEVNFQNVDDVHTVSHIYEDLLKRMGSENRMAGEFYTPRPIVRFMVQVIDPKIGETVYDPACGSAGFLVESYLHMKESRSLTIEDHQTLQRKTFFGQEKKPLPCLLGIMNMILHEVLTPNIRRKNTLEDNIRHIPEEERFNVILTNPPFGGKENRQIQQNFPVQSQATELLFLEHIMKKLKVGGHCGMVVPEGTLFRGDAFANVKKELLERFNLHSIVSLPAGVFLPYSGVKTNLIFFERPGPTKGIWFYEILPPEGQKFTKGNPIQDEHFEDCRAKLKERAISKQSWIVPVEKIIENGYDFTAKNPNREEDVEHRPPEELVASILDKEQEIVNILGEIQTLLAGNNSQDKSEPKE